MTFAEDLTNVARAMGRLMVEGPLAPPLDDARMVLAARQILLADLRACYERAASIRQRHVKTASPTVHPVQAVAVSLLALAGGDRLAPSLVVEHCRETEPGWAAAAQHAIALERHFDWLTTLEPATAWAVVRDLARLAATIPCLDEDLSRRLPPREPPLPYVSGVHTDLRVAAEEVVRLADLGIVESRGLATRSGSQETVRTRRLSRETAIQSLTQLLAAKPTIANRDIVIVSSAIERATRCAAPLAADGEQPALDPRARHLLERIRATLSGMPSNLRGIASTALPDPRIPRLAYLVADWSRKGIPQKGGQQGARFTHLLWCIRSAAALGDAVVRSQARNSLLVPVDSAPTIRPDSSALSWAVVEQDERTATLTGMARQLSVLASEAEGAVGRKLLSRDDRRVDAVVDALARVTRDVDRVRKSRPVSPLTAYRPLYPCDPPREPRRLAR